MPHGGDSLPAMPEDLSHSVIVLPIRAGRIAMAERAKGERMGGMYASPGGSVDPTDESLPAAAAREFEEETGLKVEPGRLVYLGRLVDKGADWMPIGGHFFLLRLSPDEELKQTEPDKHGPWTWHTFREATALPLPPVSRSLLHLLAHAGVSG